MLQQYTSLWQLLDLTPIATLTQHAVSTTYSYMTICTNYNNILYLELVPLTSDPALSIFESSPIAQSNDCVSTFMHEHVHILDTDQSSVYMYM